MGVWGHREPRRGVGVPRELWDPGRPWQGVEVPDGVWGPWQGVWGRGGGSHGELGSLGNPWGMRAHPRVGMGALRGAPGRCGAVWGPGGVWGCAGLFRGPPWGRGSLWGGAGGAGGGVGVGWLPGGSGPPSSPASITPLLRVPEQARGAVRAAPAAERGHRPARGRGAARQGPGRPGESLGLAPPAPCSPFPAGMLSSRGGIVGMRLWE